MDTMISEDRLMYLRFRIKREEKNKFPIQKGRKRKEKEEKNGGQKENEKRFINVSRKSVRILCAC
jgi:hypothetical protein